MLKEENGTLKFSHCNISIFCSAMWMKQNIRKLQCGKGNHLEFCLNCESIYGPLDLYLHVPGIICNINFLRSYCLISTSTGLPFGLFFLSKCFIDFFFYI